MPSPRFLLSAPVIPPPPPTPSSILSFHSLDIKRPPEPIIPTTLNLPNPPPIIRQTSEEKHDRILLARDIRTEDPTVRNAEE